MITLTKNRLAKNVSTGFSWKSLCFGILYPIARGDFKGMWIQLLLASLTIGFSALVVPFTYNKAYIKRLLDKGYEPHDQKSETWLINNLSYTIKED